jgi:hypothetical protein
MMNFTVRLYGSRLISKKKICLYLLGALILPLVPFVDLSDEVLERVILVQISASVFFGLQPGRKFFHRSSSGSRFAAPSRWFGAVPISQSGAKAPSLGVARFSSAGLILRFCVLVAGLELRWRPPVRLCPSSVSQPRECAFRSGARVSLGISRQELSSSKDFSFTVFFAPPAGFATD